jgi:CDP-glucose 4,6-dehydratase
VRAGNVIGGGDWAKDRLVPDIIRSIQDGRPVVLRNPQAIRPWQHVLEPLSGYLLLAEKLWHHGRTFAEAWNFGPRDDDAQSVSWLAEHLLRRWGVCAHWDVDEEAHPHEAHYLKLDCSKARLRLGWAPRTNIALALDWVVEWYRSFHERQDMRHVTQAQISTFVAL